MYNIRVRLDENDPKSEVIEGTPKEVVYKLKQLYSTTLMLYKIEELMFRLARISYETYCISHSHYLLFLIAQEICKNFNAEYEEKKSFNKKLRDLPKYLNLNYEEKAIHASKYIESPINIFLRFYRNLKFKITKDNFIRVNIEKNKMKRGVNKYCSLLEKYEKELFDINNKDFRTPIDIVELIRKNNCNVMYRYFETKKVLFIDSKQMLDTLNKLNDEYKKLHPQKNEIITVTEVDYYFDGISTDYILENDSDEVSYQYPSPYCVIFDVLEKVGVGINYKDQFYILKKKGVPKSKIHRALSFAGLIFYSYYCFTNDLSSTQSDFFSTQSDSFSTQSDLFDNMFLVPPFVFDELRSEDNKYDQIINLEKDVTELDKYFIKRFTTLANGDKKDMDSENVLREKILQCFMEYYPEYLLNIHEKNYPYRKNFFEKCEIFKLI